VKSAGEVSAPGLPKYGAFWFRKDVTLPAVQLNATQVLEFAPVATFDRVYWNGTLLGETTSRNFSGDQSVRRYFIPPSLLKEGVNNLAVRIFAPTAPPAFSWPPQVGTSILAGNWLAKAEFELPPLEKGVTPPAPKLIPLQAVTSNLFNGMIRPVIPYAITGTIWYQGEANSKQAHAYRTAFPLVIKDWRQHWQQGDFPFYFCQLANFRPKQTEPGESDWAELREAQLMTLSVPNTGQAVLIDVGETADIHPQNKEATGERLAKIALARTYGKPVAFSGPLYKSMKIEANKIRLSFTNCEGGLVAKELPATQILKTQDGSTAPLIRNSPNSQVEGFAICGEDKKWVWADAKIDGDTVLVWSDSVPSSVAARYAWADNPTCNLYNKADLPASPFRTDDFPGLTEQPAPAPVTGSR
jgi:sialate O-acetylesterase